MRISEQAVNQILQGASTDDVVAALVEAPAGLRKWAGVGAGVGATAGAVAGYRKAKKDGKSKFKGALKGAAVGAVGGAAVGAGARYAKRANTRAGYRAKKAKVWDTGPASKKEPWERMVKNTDKSMKKTGGRIRKLERGNKDMKRLQDKLRSQIASAESEFHKRASRN